MPLIIQKDPGIERKRKLAEAMVLQSQQPRPIRSLTEGFAQLAQAASGKIQTNRVDKLEKERTDKHNQTVTDAFSNSGGDVQKLAEALAGNESTSDVALQLQLQKANNDDQFNNQMKLKQFDVDNRQTKEPTLTTAQKNAAALYPDDPNKQREYIQQVTTKSNAANVTVNNNQAPQLTVGQEALDKEFAKNTMTDLVSGQGADSAKMLSQLKEVHEALGSSDNLTGSIVGNTPAFLKNIINPESVATQEAVEEVVQRNLREVLGAQFTEKEGERLISRAYNPKLPEAENRKRVGRLIKQMEIAHQSKQAAAEYFNKNGTLQGFKGKMPSIEDFYTAIDQEEPDEGWSIKERP